MKITLKVGLICAAIWIVVKMIFFWTAEGSYDLTPLILLNLFLCLTAISVGLYLHKRKETEDSNALNDIKNGMTAGVPYAIIIGVFTYFYYEKIDPEYNAHQIADMEYAVQQELEKPDGLEKYRGANEEFEVLSKEEIFEKISDNIRAMYSSGSVTSLALLGLVIMSALNSIFVTIIYRKVVFTQNKARRSDQENTLDEQN